MQYILTQEEYDALKAKQEVSLKLSTEKLQELCTKIADTMPVKVYWNKEFPEPWGCIHSSRDDECEWREWFCDECPVQEICPEKFKSWSK